MARKRGVMPSSPAKTAYFGFSGLIDPGGVTRICSALNHAANNNFDQVHLCINSAGGYVGDGVYLYNHIRAMPIEVVTHNTGSVSSIAVAVFLGARKRICSRLSTFMIHPTSMMSQHEGMSWERLQASLGAALADDQRTEDILRERTTLPDDLLQARRVKDVHITSQDALKFGIVNSVTELAFPLGHEIVQI
jgi:ATP-dependent protease ClpP protease subunit